MTGDDAPAYRECFSNFFGVLGGNWDGTELGRDASGAAVKVRFGALAKGGLAACLVATGTVAAAGPAAAAPAWSILTSPSQTGSPQNTLSGVACPTAVTCYAVGSYTFDGAAQQMFVKHWDNTNWTIGVLQQPAGATSSTLTAITCPGATSCFAVGGYTSAGLPKTLVEHWDGASWTIQPSPNQPGATNNLLLGVACPTASACFSVGSFDTVSTERPLIQQWNGTNWTNLAVTLPTGATFSSLSSAGCASATSCWAGGTYSTSTTQKTLLEHWNSTSWAPATSGNPTGALSGVLSGIACPTATTCFATGSYDTSSATKTLIERLTGTTGTVITSPSVGTFSTLGGVSCPGATTCFAVGQIVGTSGTTLIERWNGTSFSTMTSPNAPGALDSALNGVACISTASCFAVGGSDTSVAVTALIEHWNNTSWTVGSSAALTGATFTSLKSISCPSTTLCVAVGTYLNGLLTKGFAALWNGTTWTPSTLAAAPAGATNTSLSSVTCVSTTSCFAVGHWDSSTTENSLAEHWDGSVWTVQTSANNTGTVAVNLESVACISATNCFAVGEWSSTTAQKTLVMHYNGTQWTLGVSPSPAGATDVSLKGVACPASNSCFAVGNWDTDTDTHTLIEHWTGSWAIQTSANPSTIDIDLAGVACPSITSCFATGHYSTGTVVKTLSEHWNGTSWNTLTSPNPVSATDSRLFSISCTSITSCFAVGANAASPGDQTLIEQFSGSSWTLMTSANPAGTIDSRLNGVKCWSNVSCMAVGDNQVSANQRSLIEQYA